MTKQKEFIGLFMTPDGSRRLVVAVYRVFTNEDWEHPTIEMGETTHVKDDPMFLIAFECAAPAYVVLRDLCFKRDGYDAG